MPKSYTTKDLTNQYPQYALVNVDDCTYWSIDREWTNDATQANWHISKRHLLCSLYRNQVGAVVPKLGVVVMTNNDISTIVTIHDHSFTANLANLAIAITKGVGSKAADWVFNQLATSNEKRCFTTAFIAPRLKDHGLLSGFLSSMGIEDYKMTIEGDAFNGGEIVLIQDEAIAVQFALSLPNERGSFPWVPGSFPWVMVDLTATTPNETLDSISHILFMGITDTPKNEWLKPTL